MYSPISAICLIIKATYCSLKLCLQTKHQIKDQIGFDESVIILQGIMQEERENKYRDENIFIARENLISRKRIYYIFAS